MDRALRHLFRRRGPGLLFTLLLAGLTAGRAWGSELEWRAAVGAEINPVSHGVLDLGLRKGAFSIQILTDTLDLRLAPENPNGRWWVAMRAEAAVAGLMPSPWTDGAPDPDRARYASYVGLEAGKLRYLPRGYYFGGALAAREWFFLATETTTIPLPGPTPVATLDGVAGHWSPWIDGWVRVGVDVEPGHIAPHVVGEVKLHPVFFVAPRLEVRAGWAEDQTDITRTRLGGLNPYVVPLAGAGWAEWWVEDFVAVRGGAAWQGSRGELALLADGAAFDGQTAWGLALQGRVVWRRFFAEGAVGYAPTIPRETGVGRTSIWIRIGSEWGSFRRNRA